MNLEFLTFHAHDISSPAERLINWKVYFNTHKLCLVRLASSLVPLNEAPQAVSYVSTYLLEHVLEG